MSFFIKLLVMTFIDIQMSAYGVAHAADWWSVTHWCKLSNKGCLLRAVHTGCLCVTSRNGFVL